MAGEVREVGVDDDRACGCVFEGEGHGDLGAEVDGLGEVSEVRLRPDGKGVLVLRCGGVSCSSVRDEASGFSYAGSCGEKAVRWTAETMCAGCVSELGLKFMSLLEKNGVCVRCGGHRYEVRRDQMKCLHCGHEATRHVRVVKDVKGRNVVIPMGSGRMLESCPGCGSKFPAWRLNSCGMVALQGMATWDERPCV